MSVNWTDLIEDTPEDDIKFEYIKLDDKKKYVEPELIIDWDNYETHKPIEIMKMQSDVSGRLRGNIKDCPELTSDIIETYITKLEWLAKTSKYLCSIFRTQELRCFEPKDPTKIPRSSYRFCEYTSECNHQYSKEVRGRNSCRKEHFVHNKIYKDIISLITYLKNPDAEMSEIITSLNTISFVFNHMSSEATNLELYKINFV